MGGLDPKTPPMLANRGENLIEVTRWPNLHSTEPVIRIEVKNRPTLLIDHNGKARFVRWHRTRNPRQYVYISKREFQMSQPIADAGPHELLVFYVNCVDKLPGHLRFGSH